MLLRSHKTSHFTSYLFHKSAWDSRKNPHSKISIDVHTCADLKECSNLTDYSSLQVRRVHFNALSWLV